MSSKTASMRTNFPSQAVPIAEKESLEYGKEVGKAIENEWFARQSNSARFFTQRESYHTLRLYARGEQSPEKYKNEISVNGDTSYMNLDWKPVPIIPKFVDIVVNGISERPYAIKAYSQDPASMHKRTAYIEGMVSDIRNKELFSTVQQELGMNMFENDPNNLPADEEELAVQMQLEYKESIEIAEEEAIANVFALNNYNELVKKRVDYDLVTIGIGCSEHLFNTSEGIVIKYHDPADIIYSYTESPYFDDIYYQGVVDKMSISEVKKSYPHLTPMEVEELETLIAGEELGYTDTDGMPDLDNGYVYVMRYYYKTYHDQVYKLKHTASGAEKIIEKEDTWNPPEEALRGSERVVRSVEVIYEGAKIVGHDIQLEWKLSENMTKPNSDITKVHFPINIVAPRMYRGVPESLVGRMIGFADNIQIVHLKLQQVASRVIPDGIYMDVDGLVEIDLSNGTKYDPQEAINMFFQTGTVLGRSLTSDGDFNHAKIPIQELNHSGANAKISALIALYNTYLQQIRDVTGLNEARDGSTPDKDALVGLQKLAAANSNTATRHIVDAGMYLTVATAEGVSLRMADILKFANTRESFISALGKFNVATLTEVKDLHNHDFGIYIEVAPDEEEKQRLEENIQMALSRELIELDDAIDIRSINNTKLANQVIKVRRRRKQEKDRAEQLQNIQAQAQANGEAAERAAQADVFKEQSIIGQKAELEKLKSKLEIERLDVEVEKKRELMMLEYQINKSLQNSENVVIDKKEAYKEDRKDRRTKLQATQQSELIEQRQKGTPPKDFESSGNDVIGDIGLEQFSPK